MDIQDKLMAFLTAAVPKIGFALLILVVGYFVVKLIIRILRKTLTKLGFDVSLINFLLKASKIVLYIVLIISAFAVLGVPTSGMIAALSAAAVAVSLALKDSLSNIASGIVILASHPFVTGDFITAGDVSGTVCTVDMFQTVITTPDNKTIVIPNSQIASNEIINYSTQEYRRVELNIPVSYKADLEKVKATALKVIKAHPLVKETPEPPLVRVMEYSDSSVKFVCRAWCNTSNYWNLYFDLNEQIKKAFDEEKIEIPYNQVDVHIVERR